MADNQENLAKSFEMIGDSLNRMWLMWQSSLKNVAWAQEQMENMTRTQLENNKAFREEWLKLVEDLGQQTRRNQEQFQKMLEEVIESSYQYFGQTS
ncbi:MAG: hypothetical protein GYA42_09120 [Syntrophomonadaceae bacterium]|nr:hypothetical protein [Syntrophomonadaceae bacterium]